MTDERDNPFGGDWLRPPVQTPANDDQPAHAIPRDVMAVEQVPPEAIDEIIAMEDAPTAMDVPPPVAETVVVPLPPKEPAQPRAPILVEKNSGLSVSHLGKRYAKRPVVRDVSLSLQRGEAVGLLGPNGAGKTTCFYMITGLISPDVGSISLDGTDITNLPMYRRARLGIGYLPQEASIFRGLSVEQNIMAVLEVSEQNPERRRAMCDELLAEFSITHLRQSPAIALSGGERRRAEIARALAGRPSFILLDEPLAGIDPIAISDVRDLVKHLKNRGIGVLITDHNVRETLDVIDRAYIIHDGTVLMEGSPSDIVNNHEVRRVYLGEKFSL
jgi:lipopolysaccharide export system ATP-binding protein